VSWMNYKRKLLAGPGSRSSRERRRKREKQRRASTPDPASSWTWMNFSTRVNATLGQTARKQMKRDRICV